MTEKLSRDCLDNRRNFDLNNKDHIFTIFHTPQMLCFIANESPSPLPHISARFNGLCHHALSIIPTKVSFREARDRNLTEIMSLFCRIYTSCSREDGHQEGIEDYWITTPPSTSTNINMDTNMAML